MPVRPSPTPSATLFPVGTKKRGNDGRTYVVVATRTGVQRWQPVPVATKVAKATKDGTRSDNKSFRAVKQVYVVDNGGVPFIVRLSALRGSGKAQVLVAPKEYDDDEEEALHGLAKDHPRVVAGYKPWRTIPYLRAWVGLDPEEPGAPRPKRSGLLSKLVGAAFGKASWWHGGNSVLLQVGVRKYVFVGDRIIEFSTPPDDAIVELVSPMGNSAVPYPYAIGTTNTYLLIEDTWIANAARLPFMDPYEQFYEHDPVTGEKYTGPVQGNKRMRAHQATHKVQGLRVLHERVW